MQLISDLQAARGSDRLRMSRREDWTTVALAGWLIAGLFVDGWAHNTQPNLETFFTPWHALFYSGFTATAGWVAWSVLRRAKGAGGRPARDLRALADVIPVGYGWAVGGLVIFGISGLGDLTWHQIFGIEQDVKALLSPTHLGLISGGFLIVTAPARSQAADPALGGRPDGRALLPAIVSATLASCVIGFILQAWNPFEDNPASFDGMDIRSGVAEYLLATMFLFGPLLWLAQRWQLPFLAPVVLIGVQAVLIQAMIGLPSPGLAGLEVLGATAVGGLAAAVRPGPGSVVRTRVFMTVAPESFWLITLVGLASPAGPGLGWDPEVWGGSVVWSALVGVGMTLLRPQPDAAAGRAVGAAS
jgi:hypothetical protein